MSRWRSWRTRRGAAVITADREDILAVSPALAELIIGI
jgi:hypothetical protein